MQSLLEGLKTIPVQCMYISGVKWVTSVTGIFAAIAQGSILRPYAPQSWLSSDIRVAFAVITRVDGDTGEVGIDQIAGCVEHRRYSPVRVIGILKHV